MPMYERLPPAMFGVLVGAVAVVWALWGSIPTSTLVIWLACNVAYALWRLDLRRSFPGKLTTPEELRRWSRLWLIGTPVLAAIWGSAGLLMLPEAPELRAGVVTALMALCMAAAPLEARYLPALYAFVGLILGPVALRLLWEGGGSQIFLAVISLLALYGIVVFGREIHANMREAIRRRYENIDLIAELTAQKADLERARLEAENANLSKTRFLAAASHDLRQPLHALGLFSGALKAKTRDPADERIVQNISDSVEALENQFNALLDISKLDAGTVKPKVTAFALRPLLERMRMDYEGAALAAGVALRVVPCSCWARSDPFFVERILRNLVSNAVRYTERGKILVGCRRQGQFVRLEVWDTGIGIAQDQLAKIWEEFYQIGNPERDRQKGLGLGLATVKRLVRLIGTRVDVRSQAGRGSLFRFRLPLAEAPQSPAAAARPETSTSQPDSLAGKLVVALDDELAVREGMRVLLAQWGCDVLAAGSLDEVLERLPEFDRYPDVLLVDYRLRQGATGVEAIRRIRHELGIEVPAVLISATTLPESLVEIAAVGLELIYKPVTADKLRERLQALLHPNLIG